MPKKPTMLVLLHEHNAVYGFWFVLIEFFLVALVALYAGVSELKQGGFLWAAGFIGIAVNAIAICATVIGQVRQDERSGSINQMFFGRVSEEVRREHPDLGRHTLQILAATLVPFLLAALAIFDK